VVIHHVLTLLTYADCSIQDYEPAFTAYHDGPEYSPNNTSSIRS
jgi:hypothetical protein